mmetsp:Transcript_23180/g.35279  ORF Transcript_23180/g.35279 Transcript_23180/m.35279 type:complete len:83 (+) Transcript_23180:157-405(+)|eukprot:CAMPEP_0117002506 /NCGR_PEP_ID=MMETSP0472-20121206/4156_1 /TAXON_ID=693140 ORGANISM="Tiarina fusus, Strain LIS" /NCGR_SAMPLE_ID=MMETSP0472 /ASSEMBLY_ACC=CAM_ASM_000603 /LENGTH=82 /DNA_ID=CAMNT_0004702883 /DNA_START=214 /DNA_END=462 /DNA_ORIENTATION=-
MTAKLTANLAMERTLDQKDMVSLLEQVVSCLAIMPAMSKPLWLTKQQALEPTSLQEPETFAPIVVPKQLEENSVLIVETNFK